MAFQGPARSIDFITSDRMANIGHVNPDLVGSPSLQLQLDQTIIPETFQDMETGQGWFPLWLSQPASCGPCHSAQSAPR